MNKHQQLALQSSLEQRHAISQLETPSISYTGALVGVEADRSDLGADRPAGDQIFACLSQVFNRCHRTGKTVVLSLCLF